MPPDVLPPGHVLTGLLLAGDEAAFAQVVDGVGQQPRPLTSETFKQNPAGGETMAVWISLLLPRSSPATPASSTGSGSDC